MYAKKQNYGEKFMVFFLDTDLRGKRKTVGADTLRERKPDMRNGKYPILQAQMVIRGMTRRDLAEQIHISYVSMNRKMAGMTPFTLDEAIRNREALGTETALEKLFGPAGGGEKTAVSGQR